MRQLHILGSGSIGLLWAFRIRYRYPKYPLHLLVRAHHLPKLVDGQVRIGLHQPVPPDDQASKSDNSFVWVPAQAITSNLQDISPPIETLIVCTKAYQAADAIADVTSSLSPSCRIILLSNGAFAVRDALLSSLPDPASRNLYLATTTNGVYRTDPDSFSIFHVGKGRTFIERKQDDDDIRFSEDMAALWKDSGLGGEAISTSEIEILLWKKLAANCVINPLTALLKCQNGQLLLEPAVPEIMASVLKETSQVARASLGRSESRLSHGELLSFVHQVIRDTAKNKSSMLQDVVANRRTEIDQLNGYVVQKGRTSGIECPVNDDLATRVRELYLSRRL